MGSAPPWYFTIKAAKYLGVAPWDLVDKPAVWVDMALEMESAEKYAENEIRKRSKG